MTIALAVAYLQLLFTTPVCQCLPSYHAEPKCSRPHSSEDTMRDRFDRLLFASCSQMKMVGGQINVNGRVGTVPQSLGAGIGIWASRGMRR